MFWFVFILVLLLIDLYVFQAVVNATKNWGELWKTTTRYAFWAPTVFSIGAILYYVIGDPDRMSHTARSFLLTGLFAIYISKIFGVLFIFLDDLQRGIKYVARFFYRGADGQISGDPIPRSEFLSRVALVATAVPFGTMAYGILSGAHDYRVRRKTVYLPNLPKAFDGIKIGQLSDIHTGSFFNRTAVKGGVEMFLREKPDVILVTGDLVNNQSSELTDYINVFDKLRAPYGVFSTTGNHDYGDYMSWPSVDAKKKNLKDFFAGHKQMGFDLLLNENRLLTEGGDKIAIIGIENWGAGRFSKYGRLDLAHQGTDDASVKLLLSHDPSHWDAQVRPFYPDIDLSFAGHTHGFQFGIEVGKIKWSPSQYVYKQWAGLYQEGSQYLYVNRGFGYLGYPGRVGMPPELTIIELKRGNKPA